MRSCVHLALQDLRGAGDGEFGDLSAQRFLRALDFLLDLGLRRRDDAVGLRLRLGLRVLDGVALQLLTLGDDFGSACLRLGHHFGDALFGARQALPSFLASR